MQTRWIYYKTENIHRIYSSLGEAFGFFWTSLEEVNKNFTKIDQEQHKIEKIHICNPLTTGLIMSTLKIKV